jgi:hypothetical protein
MKGYLYKLKEGYVLCSDKKLNFNYNESMSFDDFLNVLSNNLDFSELKEEDVKRIGWFDVEKLAENEFPHIEIGLSEKLAKEDVPYVPRKQREAFELGFQKALELTSDRRFTEDDIKQAYYQGRKDAVNSVTNKLDFINPDDYIKSISQPKSWEVEYKEENGVYKVLKIN